MNVFPINSEQKEIFISDKKSENLTENFSVALPKNWWSFETSYSSSEQAQSSLRSEAKNRKKYADLKNSHKHWSVRHGDHRVNEPYKKDYVYYRELKNKALKYSVFPALLFVGFAVYFISHVLSNL